MFNTYGYDTKSMDLEMETKRQGNVRSYYVSNLEVLTNKQIRQTDRSTNIARQNEDEHV